MSWLIRWDAPGAHNGYMELWLGVGILGREAYNYTPTEIGLTWSLTLPQVAGPFFNLSTPEPTGQQ